MCILYVWCLSFECFIVIQSHLIVLQHQHQQHCSKWIIAHWKFDCNNFIYIKIYIIYVYIYIFMCVQWSVCAASECECACTVWEGIFNLLSGKVFTFGTLYVVWYRCCALVLMLMLLLLSCFYSFEQMVVGSRFFNRLLPFHSESLCVYVSVCVRSFTAWRRV